MSKHLVIAETKEEAIYSKKNVFKIDDSLFDIIQYIINSRTERYDFPVLWDLFEDQYNDNIFKDYHLKKLQEEVLLFLKIKNLNVKIKNSLKKIKQFAGQALKSKKNLYAFGD